MSRRAKAVPQAPLLWLVPPPPPVKAGKRRAVLVLPARHTPRQLDLCGSFAVRQGLNVVAVCWAASDGLRALMLDRADVLIAITSTDLWPAIRLVADERADLDDDATRRPSRRTYRL